MSRPMFFTVRTAMLSVGRSLVSFSRASMSNSSVGVGVVMTTELRVPQRRKASTISSAKSV